MGALILDAATGVIIDEHGWPVELTAGTSVAERGAGAR